MFPQMAPVSTLSLICHISLDTNLTVRNVCDGWLIGLDSPPGFSHFPPITTVRFKVLQRSLSVKGTITTANQTANVYRVHTCWPRHPSLTVILVLRTKRACVCNGVRLSQYLVRSANSFWCFSLWFRMIPHLTCLKLLPEYSGGRCLNASMFSTLELLSGVTHTLFSSVILSFRWQTATWTQMHVNYNCSDVNHVMRWSSGAHVLHSIHFV